MTILATHFAIVLGAWRLRIRIDIDEPREDFVGSGTAADDASYARPPAPDRARSAASSLPRWN